MAESDAPLPEDPKLRKLADQLRGMYEAAEVDQPDENLLSAATINVGPPKFRTPPHVVSARLADLLAGRNVLFKRGVELGTVQPSNGAWRQMKAETFCTWLPNTVGIHPVAGYHKTNGVPILADINVQLARLILQSDDIADKMPVIEGINHVKMPVWRVSEDGKRELVLLGEGYDARAKIYTALCGPNFDEKMDAKDAVRHLWNIFKYFAWRSQNRDWPIMLAAMLTMFARGLYEGKAPAFIINANIQASGKSRLAEFICWLVHGHAFTRPLLEDSDEKLQDTLETAAKGQKPYVYFDNVDWRGKTIVCPLLDEWITSKGKEFRVKGVSEDWQGQLRGLTILTGNTLKLSDDLQRRSLMCDLYNPLAAEDRPPLPKDAVVLNDPFFSDAKNREKGLAALWALCRQWDADGRPTYIKREYASFEDWSLIIPEIVAHAGRLVGEEWDCMAPSANLEVGNKQTREYTDLAKYGIVEFGMDPQGGFKEVFEVTVAQLAGVARRNQMATEKLYPEMTVADVRSTEGERGGFKAKLEDWVQGEDREREIELQASEYLSPKTRSSFGNALKSKLHERQFLGPDGFRYEYRSIPNAAPARYRVTRMDR